MTLGELMGLLQGESKLNMENRGQALQVGTTMRDNMLKQAATQAAALQAREGQTSVIDSEVGAPTHATTTQDLAEVPEGASDELAAAIGDRRTKTRMDEATLAKTDSSAELTAARALLANPEFVRRLAAEKLGSAEKIAGNRDATSRDTAGAAAEARRYAADKGAEARKYATDNRPAPVDPLVDVPDPQHPGHVGKGTFNRATRTVTPIEGTSKPSGLVARLEKGAQSVEDQGNQLLTELAPGGQFYDQVGPLLTRYQTLKAGVGVRDPIASELVGALRSFGSAHLNLYPRGGSEIVKKIEELIETPQTPQSLAGGLKGLMRLSRSLQASTPAKDVGAAAAGDDPLGLRQ